MREFWMRLMSVVVIVGVILGYNSVLEEIGRAHV